MQDEALSQPEPTVPEDVIRVHRLWNVMGVVGPTTIGALTLAAPAVFGHWAAGVVALALGAIAYSRFTTRYVNDSMAMIIALDRRAERAREQGTLDVLDAQKFGGMAPIAERYNHVVRSVVAALEPSRARAESANALPHRLLSSLETIEASAGEQEGAVEEVASLMANINRSIEEINGRVERLQSAAEESSSSILEMSSSVDNVASNTGSLNESVETCASAVDEMGASIRQVAQSADHVQRGAEDTAASMVQMDRSVGEVSNHVQEASALTARVSSGAEAGSVAVSATIEDIGRIDGLTRDARDVIERLAARIDEISNILEVMGDINDETNLLSLNAAIIAAQAGEQGKAFLVVANHVKTLAQRTANSTKEIAGVIDAVQQESDNAVAAMGAGIDAIAQGVARSRKAGESLSEIRQSAADASSRVAEIARASEEQARNSKQVANAAQETSLQIQQITTALAEQLRASERMSQASEEALEMCRQVHRSTNEQRETGRYIATSIGLITEMIRDIQENTARHATASAQVSGSVQHLLRNATSGADEIPQLRQLAETVRDDLGAIRGQLEALDVPSGVATRPN